MPWVTINGEQKKVACGPCIRGHRSTSCNHKDRLLLEVRKPGRPLSSCPHLGGNCSCERLVINYTIPRSSECACPGGGDEVVPVAEVVSSTTGPLPGPSTRVQKKRKSVSHSRNPAAIEKAVKAAENAEQKIKAEPPKSCCSQKQPPTTESSSTSTAPTPSSNSPSSHDEMQNACDSSVVPQQVNGEAENKPLNIQVEARKQSTGYAPPAQVQGWKHMTVEGLSDAKIAPKETSTVPKGSCCSGGGGGGGKAANSDAASIEAIRRSSVPAAGGHQQQSLNQNSNGVHSRLLPTQQPFGPGQQYMFQNGQHQIGSQIQRTPFSNGPPSNVAYNASNHQQGHYPSMYYSFTPHHQLPNGFNNSLADLEHNCSCGDGCACIGCLTHPKNQSTIHHLVEVVDFMANDPYYDNPSSPPQNDHQIQYQTYPAPGGIPSATAQQSWQNSNPRQPYQQQIPAFRHPASSAPFAQDVNGSFWQQPRGSSSNSVQATPTNELQQFHFQDSRNGEKNVGQREAYSNQSFHTTPFSYQPTTTYESSMPTTPFVTADPAPSTTAETPTLSPSSFFWHQVELPGCNDASGACRCGDGCQCVGCLTHGGHDGVPLQQPVADYQAGSGFQTETEQSRTNGHGGLMDASLNTQPAG